MERWRGPIPAALLIKRKRKGSMAVASWDDIRDLVERDMAQLEGMLVHLDLAEEMLVEIAKTVNRLAVVRRDLFQEMARQDLLVSTETPRELLALDATLLVLRGLLR
jgi:hypothetical protein